MELQIDARQLLEEGSLKLLRLPKPETEFVTATNQTIAWRHLEVHFPPRTWWAWADQAMSARPFVMPQLQDYLVRYDFHQLGGHPGQVCIVHADGGSSFNRIVIPGGDVAVSGIWSVVASLLGIDTVAEPELTRTGSRVFTPNRSIAWSPYFDRGGRHIADRSG